MKEIILLRGQIALVDDEDYSMVSLLRWTLSSMGYARRFEILNGKRHEINMHHFVKNVVFKGREIIIDHINRNKLDNRKINLRICTFSQNSYNRCAKRNGSSRYKGVSRSTKNDRWYASISRDGSRKFLGSFHCENEAAQAYNSAAKILFGEYAYLNEVNNER